MATPVTFGEYHLLEQIKRLNLRKMQLGNQLRAYPKDIVLPGYPDSYTYAQTMLQLSGLINLYMTPNAFENTRNPEMKGIRYEPSQEGDREYILRRKLFGKDILVKSAKHAFHDWSQQLDMLREYYIGTRLNDLRGEIPHFMFTYGYMMCWHKEGGPCVSENVLVDTKVTLYTPLERQFPQVRLPLFDNYYNPEMEGLRDLKDEVRRKWYRGKDDKITKLLVTSEEKEGVIREYDFSHDGALLDEQILHRISQEDDVPKKWLRANVLNREQTRIPYILLEKVEAQDNLFGWFKKMLNDPKREEHVYSVYFQLVLALSVAQERFCFVHGDLHPENILITQREKPEVVTYHISGAVFRITSEYIPVIIDYGWSRITDDHMAIYPTLDYVKKTFNPRIDFYKLTETFQNLFHKQSFPPYENLFKDKKTIVTSGFHFISILTRYSSFKHIVQIADPLQPIPFPNYWGLSSGFVSGQPTNAQTPESVGRWCDKTNDALRQCNQDTGSLVLNTVQTRMLNEASAYIESIENKVIRHSYSCLPKRVHGIPLTAEQIRVDGDGIDLAAKVPFYQIANDSQNELITLMIPEYIDERPHYNDRPEDRIMRRKYTAEESIECARVLADKKKLFDAAERTVSLVKYLTEMALASEQFDEYFEQVLRENKWDQYIPQLCDPRKPNLLKANFLEKYKSNETYLRQFLESLQILLDMITRRQLYAGHRDELLQQQAETVVESLLKLFVIVPHMFNVYYIEFIRSQLKMRIKESW